MQKILTIVIGICLFLALVALSVAYPLPRPKIALADVYGSSLISWFNFDNNQIISGTTVKDLSGQGNDGTLSTLPGPTTGTAGVLGQSMQTAGGTADYMAVNNNTDSLFNGLTTLTVAVWMNQTSQSATARAVVAKWGIGGTTRTFTIETTNTNEILYAVQGAGVFHIANITSTMATNKWYHVCAVWSGGTSMTIYINGVAAPLNTSTNGNVASLSASGNKTLEVDQESNGGSTKSSIAGYVDDVRIYNRALTNGDCMQLYYMGLSTHAQTHF